MIKIARNLLLIVASTLALGRDSQAGETRFTIVSSSSGSWVARGLSDYTLTTLDGWSFTVGKWQQTKAIEFRASGPPSTPELDRWTVRFQAPFEAVLTPGVYSGFQKYPLNDIDKPALGFNSTGRTDGSSTGSFTILDIVRGAGDEIVSFAADFTYYGGQQPDQFAQVEVRYNYPVPEPNSFVIVISASLSAIAYHRHLAARERGR